MSDIILATAVFMLKNFCYHNSCTMKCFIVSHKNCKQYLNIHVYFILCRVCKDLLLLKYLLSFVSFSLAASATGDAVLPSVSDLAAESALDTRSCFDTFCSS